MRWIHLRTMRDLGFRCLSSGVVLFSCGVFLLLLGMIVRFGSTALWRTEVLLTLPETSKDLSFCEILENNFPNLQKKLSCAQELVSWGAHRLIQDAQQKKMSQVWVPLHDEADGFYKSIRGILSYDTQRLTDEQLEILNGWKKSERICLRFNGDFLFRPDSQEPELAGLAGAFVGSFYTLCVAFCVAFPLGVSAGIYLQEWAPANRWTSWIDLHIQNLSAVPSVIFGLLGLVIWNRFLHIARPSSLLGGLTLALMLCPMFALTTRLALQGVPHSLRDAAKALGASKVQVIVQHCLPAAFPAILTGALVTMIRALGESAPLLMVGMVIFLGDIPQNLTDPATVLPIQVFLWARNGEFGCFAQTMGAILGILFFVVVINGLVALLKSRWRMKFGSV